MSLNYIYYFVEDQIDSIFRLLESNKIFFWNRVIWIKFYLIELKN